MTFPEQLPTDDIDDIDVFEHDRRLRAICMFAGDLLDVATVCFRLQFAQCSEHRGVPARRNHAQITACIVSGHFHILVEPEVIRGEIDAL